MRELCKLNFVDDEMCNFVELCFVEIKKVPYRSTVLPASEGTGIGSTGYNLVRKIHLDVDANRAKAWMQALFIALVTVLSFQL